MIIIVETTQVAKKDEPPPKRPNTIRSGTNTVTKLVEKKKAQLVVIAHDVDPIEVSSFFLMVCHVSYSYCTV